VVLPSILFVVTCASTLFSGGVFSGPLTEGLVALSENEVALAARLLLASLGTGLWYALPVMTILICHEAGHFVQAWRYGVHASLPYFLPMPLSPFGTMGAFIVMERGAGDRKALFDIGISGPLAGLVPTLIFSIVGLWWSRAEVVPQGALLFGDPPLFRWFFEAMHGPLPEGYDMVVHPMAFAGWVGFLVTAINLFPIGQLDGGHVLYGLLRARAHAIALLVLFGATAAVVVALTVYGEKGAQGWILMLFLLFLMGPRHPPTADDNVPLGFWRHVLGWLLLAYLPFGFTPLPILSMP
jgi:membrane-associated protease RseP (regulator of RpoE activity)